MTKQTPVQGQSLKIVAGKWGPDGTTRTMLESGWELRVAGLIPTEEVTVRVTHVSRGGKVAWARLASAPPESAARRLPPCQHAENCGACGLLHVADRDQFNLKVDSALPELPPELAERLLEAPSWIRSAEALGYRHKAIFLPRVGRKGLELGAYARRTHEVVPLTHCEVITPALREARDILRATLEQPVVGEDLPLRSLILRSNQAGQVLATLILGRPYPRFGSLEAKLVELAESVIGGRGPLVGVHVQVHEADGDAVFGRGPTSRLAGGDYLRETVAGLEFRIRPLAFFQVNPAVLAGIVALLRSRLGSPGPVAGLHPLLLDLYCGGGVLGLATLSDRSEWRLLGVDSSEPNIEDARHNAAALSSAERNFHHGSVTQLIPSDEWRDAHAAILDPPRSGLRAEVLTALTEAGPARLFYVACSTKALARDAAALLAAGYQADFLCPADMMPQTPYIEWVAGFSRPSKRVELGS